MDTINNIARQQQSQINSGESQGVAKQGLQQQVQQAKQPDIVKEMQKESVEVSQDARDTPKINSKEQMEDLVKQLNEAMGPMSTNIKFGVDSQDIFYVSVIEAETNKMIRRFPAEQAADFLPKMQEVTGILFDTKG